MLECPCWELSITTSLASLRHLVGKLDRGWGEYAPSPPGSYTGDGGIRPLSTVTSSQRKVAGDPSNTPVNPWPPGGGGGSGPSRDFSGMTSLALQVSSRNLAYLFVHQFYVLTQNFGKNLQNLLIYTDLSDPVSCYFWSKFDIFLKNNQKHILDAKCK